MILIDTQKEEFSKLKDIRIFGKISNEDRFNGDLLIIGLGGVGSSVAKSLKGMLADNITSEDNINFLIIDSDIPAMEQTIEDSKTGLGFNALEILSIYRPNLANILENGIDNNPVHPKLARWMKSDFPNISIGTDGAKGNRQIGRLMFSNAYSDIRILLFEKLMEIYEGSVNKKLDIIIISGLGGGTGSGIIEDLTYNIKAFARSKKWTDVRVGGCLLTPDVLFGNRAVYDDKELVSLMQANACAALKEISHLMKLEDGTEPYVFESGDHRLSMRENIFDVCMLVTGKKDDQGYIPENVLYSDTAYFLFKLACNKYIGTKDEAGNRKLLRDVFFSPEGKGYFKVVNESDYKIPIKEIENICEHQVFNKAFSKLYEVPDVQKLIETDMGGALNELRSFLDGKPGDEINLNVNGLIKIGQFTKPVYKSIKKGQDGLRNSMSRQLSNFKEESPVIVKSLKNRLYSSIEEQLQRYMSELGPFAVMEIIGAAGIGSGENDRGLIAEVKKLSEKHKEYKHTSEYSRIIESILDIVAHRFFTFPNAKRETENGYYDACMKETLASERTIIMEGIDSQDVFGDTIRWLRQRAERLEEIYSQFAEDLKNSVEDLAAAGKNTAAYLLKDAKQHEFLPYDYVTEARINEIRKGIIRLMVDHEADIDNARVVPVRQEIEKIYKEFFMSIGVYAPEKLVAVAFADKIPTLQEENVMFVSATNDRRDEIMARAAKSFVEGSREKIAKKKLCVLKDNSDDILLKKTYISLPEAMPHFSNAVKTILTGAPYNEPEESITLNQGEIEIAFDDIYIGVPVSMLSCAEEMQKAYDEVDKETYMGLHVNEVSMDNRIYPDIV